MFRTPGFRSSGTAVPPHKNIHQLKKDWIEIVFSTRISEFKDSDGAIYDITNRKWSAAQYAMKSKTGTDLDIVVGLVKQCYKLSKYSE